MDSVDALPSLYTLTLEQLVPEEAKKSKAQKKQQKPKESGEQMTRKDPKAYVMYLGVAILSSALQPIMSLDAVQTLFAKCPDLKKKEEFHITLLVFPKKCADKEIVVGEFRQFIAQNGDEVSITVTGIGYHEGTCALQVSPTILTKESNITVPWTHEKQNHITIALEEGKSAKNSIIAVMKQEEGGDYPGDFIPFEPSIPITGNLRTF
jgi:hypothetical protein